MKEYINRPPLRSIGGTKTHTDCWRVQSKITAFLSWLIFCWLSLIMNLFFLLFQQFACMSHDQNLSELKFHFLPWETLKHKVILKRLCRNATVGIFTLINMFHWKNLLSNKDKPSCFFTHKPAWSTNMENPFCQAIWIQNWSSEKASQRHS